MKRKIFEVVYIESSVDAVWEALTNPSITERYWLATRIVSDWKTGSKIRCLRNGKLVQDNLILAIEPPRSLSYAFQPVAGEFGGEAEAPSRVTIMTAENGGVVRLTVRHDGFPAESEIFRACSDRWPVILSSLKTLLESGKPLPPFTFPPQLARFR